jgi:glycyl-tRNA synthetase
MALTSLDPIINLAKRRGFVFPSAEIYGGTGGVWDYAPLGVLLKNNIKNEWWKAMVQTRSDIVGLDSAIITKSDVLKASGHVDNFTDPLIECKGCNTRFRADKPPFDLPANVNGEDEAAMAKLATMKCPSCGKIEWAAPRRFNMMFQTYMGAAEDSSALAYLRPETAQGIFTNFKSVLETSRKKLPFGIAQIGKAFRNEIQTGNFIFRDREFEQMELEYFVKPVDAIREWEGWVAARETWYLNLGMKKENIQLREHEENERAHYAQAATDIEYNFPGIGFSELEGIANRGDYDLTQHQQASGRDLNYFDEEKGDKYLPYVIEPSVGLDRATLAFLCDAYVEYPNGRQTSTPTEGADVSAQAAKPGDLETVLHLHPRLAPYKVAVLPLMKKEGMPDLAHQIEATLRQQFMVAYDESASIGRRYRRQDEIGTPWCVTVDFDSLTEKTVTVRDRDTMAQERVAIDQLSAYFAAKLV